MSPEDVNSYDLSPGEDFLRELSDLIQPSDLPPFSAIAKYFGAVTSYGQANGTRDFQRDPLPAGSGVIGLASGRAPWSPSILR